MSSLRDAIKDEIKGKIQGTEDLVIEQALNRLFYEKPNIKEEVRFINLLLLKNGYDQERAGLHGSAIIVGDDKFCYREQVLSLFYEMAQGENTSAGLMRIFAEGNAIHEKWQRMLIRGGLGKPEWMDHTRYNDEYDLSFTPDVLCKIGKHKYVGEIKSVNTFQFKKMKSHPSAKKQLMLYMHMLGAQKGFVLCEDKNTQEFKIFVQDYDAEFIQPYINRLEKIQYYKKRFIKQHKMVKRKCKSADCKRAQQCNMRDACWDIGKGRIRLKTKENK